MFEPVTEQAGQPRCDSKGLWQCCGCWRCRYLEGRGSANDLSRTMKFCTTDLVPSGTCYRLESDCCRCDESPDCRCFVEPPVRNLRPMVNSLKFAASCVQYESIAQERRGAWRGREKSLQSQKQPGLSVLDERRQTA